MSRYFLLSMGALACLFSATSARAADAEDVKYKSAVDHCILQSQKATSCVEIVNGNPMDKTSVVADGAYDVAYDGVYGTIGTVARGVSMAGVLFDVENAPYWKRYNSELNYQNLKRFAAIRAKKDGLETCQRACLATCISSTLLEYDDRNLITHWTEGVGREKGVCREFSAMASDLMRSLGVKSKTVTGMSYEIQDGQVPKKAGGHVMVEVALPQGNFIMEPQSSECQFFAADFSKDARILSENTLNLKTR
jgi:hypothetical protein